MSEAKQWTIYLHDLPSELILRILLFIPDPSDALRFSMTCHRNRELSLPTLFRSVTFTRRNISDVISEINLYRSCLASVQHLRLGPRHRLPYWHADRRWDILSDGLILSVLPNLCSLDATEHGAMTEWSTFHHVLSCLPSTMVNFSGRVRLDVGVADTAWRTKPIPAGIERLKLEVVYGDSGMRTWDSMRSILPQGCSQTLSNLTHLALALPSLPTQATLMAGCYFPSLSAFRLYTYSLTSWRTAAQVQEFAAFLTRHASTLSELELPPCPGSHEPSEDALFAATPINTLHTLDCCVHFASTFTRFHDSSALDALGVSYYSPHSGHFLERASLDELPPFSAVRVLELRLTHCEIGREGFLSLSGLARTFPALVALHISVTDEEEDMDMYLRRIRHVQEALFSCPELQRIVVIGSPDSVSVYSISSNVGSVSKELTKLEATEECRPGSHYQVGGHTIEVARTHDRMLRY